MPRPPVGEGEATSSSRRLLAKAPREGSSQRLLAGGLRRAHSTEPRVLREAGAHVRSGARHTRDCEPPERGRGSSADAADVAAAAAAAATPRHCSAPAKRTRPPPTPPTPPTPQDEPEPGSQLPRRLLRTPVITRPRRPRGPLIREGPRARAPAAASGRLAAGLHPVADRPRPRGRKLRSKRGSCKRSGLPPARLPPARPTTREDFHPRDRPRLLIGAIDSAPTPRLPPADLPAIFYPRLIIRGLGGDCEGTARGLLLLFPR
jgi:hypothetical protein